MECNGWGFAEQLIAPSKVALHTQSKLLCKPQENVFSTLNNNISRLRFSWNNTQCFDVFDGFIIQCFMMFYVLCNSILFLWAGMFLVCRSLALKFSNSQDQTDWASLRKARQGLIIIFKPEHDQPFTPARGPTINSELSSRLMHQHSISMHRLRYL